EPYENFKFTTNKMSVSGSLFDLDKLRDVSKNVVAMLTTEKVWEYFSDWAEKYDNEFYQLLARDPDYAKAIISIGRGVPKPRKDIAVWSEMKEYMAFFYDELFVEGKEYPANMSTEDIAAVLKNYMSIYDEHDDQTEWFGKIKELSISMGYAASPKEYKQNPDAFKGHVGDISAVIRMAVTGRVNSPDMFTVMSILGKEKVLERLEKALGNL
ncbi:MAG: glutamate--tRNA ligase, partial [Oscillospiraceae bacterium]|nr:glutamate--tRNA ligase [Oscillospiraceae bacterium]